MDKELDYGQTEESDRKSQSWQDRNLYFSDVLGSWCCFRFTGSFNRKSYGSYNRAYPEAVYAFADAAELRRCVYFVPLGKYLLNTLIFTVVTTALMMVVITLAAYVCTPVLSGKNLVFTFFLSLMIPAELVMITNYATITQWGMRNSFAGLVPASVTSVFYIYLLKENFEQVPDELYCCGKGGRNL